MRHTFKATFEQQSDAQHLMDDLSAAGYLHAKLALSGATHAGPYTHQRHAVTLIVDSEPEAGRAAVIIEGAKPARFQDEQDESVPEGIDGTLTGTAGRGGVVSAYPPGAEPGILQFRHLDGEHIFGTQSATSPPAGAMHQETMGTAQLPIGAEAFPSRPSVDARWLDPDVGTSADERTAYRFGKTLRMDDRYRNRSWNEAAPGLKSEWMAFSTASSTWDEAQSSVRRGWDATTPEIDDDSYYRSHWRTSYAHGAGRHGGDDATPFYMDSSDAGTGMRAGREPGDAGQLSSWGRFEDAVLHGWNRIGLAGPDDGVSAWTRLRTTVRQGWKRGRT
jgi:hypothetical protein